MIDENNLAGLTSDLNQRFSFGDYGFSRYTSLVAPSEQLSMFLFLADLLPFGENSHVNGFISGHGHHYLSAVFNDSGLAK